MESSQLEIVQIFLNIKCTKYEFFCFGTSVINLKYGLEIGNALRQLMKYGLNSNSMRNTNIRRMLQELQNRIDEGVDEFKKVKEITQNDDTDFVRKTLLKDINLNEKLLEYRIKRFNDNLSSVISSYKDITSINDVVVAIKEVEQVVVKYISNLSDKKNAVLAADNSNLVSFMINDIDENMKKLKEQYDNFLNHLLKVNIETNNFLSKMEVIRTTKINKKDKLRRKSTNCGTSSYGKELKLSMNADAPNNKQACMQADNDGSSEPQSTDEEYDGPYPSAPNVLDLNSPDSIAEDILPSLLNKSETLTQDSTRTESFSKRNPSPYYYADLFKNKTERTRSPPKLTPKYRKSVSLDTPGAEPEVCLPKRFSITEDGLFLEVAGSFGSDSISSNDSHCTECDNAFMPPHRLLSHDIPSAVCACAAPDIEEDDLDEVLFRPSRSVFYLPRTEDLNDLECCFLTEDMSARTRQIYETAFDCKISRSDDDLDEVDRVTNHPVLLQLNTNKIPLVSRVHSFASSSNDPSIKERRKIISRQENKRPKPIPSRLQPTDNNSSVSTLSQELETMHLDNTNDKDPTATSSQLPLRGYTPSPPSTAPLPTKFHGRDHLIMNSIRSAPNLPSSHPAAHPRLKDLRLPVKSLRARETPGSSENSIIEYKTRPRSLVREDYTNRPHSMVQESPERILEIKGRPRLADQRHSLVLEFKGRPMDMDTDNTRPGRVAPKESGPILEFKGRPGNTRRPRHKYSSTESMATSSSGGSMESLRSSTSEGNRSTSSSESRHSTSLSSHSSDSGSTGCFQGHSLHTNPLSGFISHHSNKLHILSPISDKSSQEPVSETSDNNRNNNSQKASPEDIDNSAAPIPTANSTTQETTSFKAKRRMPQNKNLLNLNFQPSSTGDTEIQGSDSGISIHSREGGKSRSAFQSFAFLKLAQQQPSGISSSSIGMDSKQQQPDLADLPFDMPKLRRRRMVTQPDACTSGSATSVDLRDLPFDMPKLRRRLRGSAPAQTSTESSGVSQASSSQSVRDVERPSLGSSMFKQKLTLNLGDEASPKKMSLDLGLGTGIGGGTSSGVLRGLNLNLGGGNNDPADLVDVSIPLERQGWYHGAITRVEAEGVLRLAGEGGFLVRNSESTRLDYSLSLKSAKGFMHMRIQRSGDSGQYILGQFSKPFDSIPEMIRHFCVNRLPIRGAEHMCLLQPVVIQLL